MTIGEGEILARLKRMAVDPAARGLADDVALLGDLVITHDTIAERIHFFAFDPPSSVGWKLVAVNLSDLAAKGASPVAALLSLTIRGDGDWEKSFLSGVEAACESYGLPLVGGDTIALPPGAPRVLGLTAIGQASGPVPARGGGQVGDRLWVIGNIGDSAAGLAQLSASKNASGPLVDVYRRPVPLLAAGLAIAPHASASMDVSDGLLLDASRMAEASDCAVAIDLAALPLSEDFVAERGNGLKARMFAATGGDDYAILAALPEAIEPETLNLPERTTMTAVGSLIAGKPGISLSFEGQAIATPESLGHEHRTTSDPSLGASPVGDRP